MSEIDRPAPAREPASEEPWPERPEDWRHDAPDPPDAFAVPFTWGQGVALAGWSILAQFSAAIPFLVIGADPSAGLNLYTFLFLAQALTLLGIYLYLRSRNAWTWHLLGPVRPRWKHVPIGVGVGVAGYLIVVVLGAIAVELVGPIQPPDQELVRRSLEGGFATVLGMIAGVGIGPVVEELIYRGAVFQGLRERLGLWPAMGLSALLFGLVHLLAPFYMAILAIFGFWLAGAFHRTGSLVVPIVGHATFNAIQLTVGLLLLDGGTG